MKIRPLQDRIIVKRDDEADTIKMGDLSLYIPATAREKPLEGKIIAVGQGRILDNGIVRPLDLKVGDRVLFGKFSGTEIKVEDQDYLMMKEEDILGVIEK